MLTDALPDLTAELGFESYAYLYVQPRRSFAVSNYHPDWQRRYFDRDYQAIDPVVRTAKSTLRAFTWDSESSRRLATKEGRRFNSEAGDFGIRSGITIPVRTACRHLSMLTLASRRPFLSLERDIDQVAAVTAVAFLHARFEECAKPASAEETFHDLHP
jgi:LuxR family transcriptional activator of conjugal transfer of Ti plasmids